MAMVAKHNTNATTARGFMKAIKTCLSGSVAKVVFDGPQF
jgi:hypothetical protein